MRTAGGRPPISRDLRICSAARSYSSMRACSGSVYAFVPEAQPDSPSPAPVITRPVTVHLTHRRVIGTSVVTLLIEHGMPPPLIAGEPTWRPLRPVWHPSDVTLAFVFPRLLWSQHSADRSRPRRHTQPRRNQPAPPHKARPPREGAGPCIHMGPCFPSPSAAPSCGRWKGPAWFLRGVAVAADRVEPPPARPGSLPPCVRESPSAIRERRAFSVAPPSPGRRPWRAPASP